MGYLDKTGSLDGRRILFFPWEGKEIRVYDDADTALRIHRLFESGAEASVKLFEAVTGLFVDLGELEGVESVSGLLAAVCWEVLALDIDGSHREETGGDKIMDWEADADYIAASLLMCYGVSWDEARFKYSYRQLVNLVGMVDNETPMGQALYYRTAKPPEPRKGNEEERREFRKRRDFWALRKPEANVYESVNDKMNDAFAGLEKLARG